MKFLITTLIMFMTLLIINFKIHSINGSSNKMRFSSSLENLKDKYKEKILSGEFDQKKALNDTFLIDNLENKIKNIYKKLNLKTDELIHLRKLTTNVDEYIVFLKILIDKLNSIKKLNENMKINEDQSIDYKKEKIRNIKKNVSVSLHYNSTGKILYFII